MRLREIFRYELEYRLKSGTTWAYAGILFGVAIWMFLALADEAGHANAPERIAGLSVIIGMFGMLVTAALFGEAAVRDVEVEMDALLFTTPVGKVEFLGGRFLGSLVVNALVMVAIPVGILVATWIASTGAEEVGPLRLAAHIEPYFTLQLPNLILVGAVLFTIGMFARQTLPVYLGAIGFFIAYVVMLNYVDRISSPTLATLVDPLGAATLMELTQYWTEAERNTRLVGLPAALAWNRALWLAVAAAVLALLFGTFRFAHVEVGGRRRRGRRSVAPALPSERSWPVNVPRVSGSFGAGSAVRQTLAVARNSLADAVSSRWFVVVLVACVGLIVLWGWNVGDTVFDTSTWPVTLLIVEEVLSSRSGPLLPVLIALYAGELVWKERAAGTGPIADAAPVPEGAMLAGRFLALVALLVMFQAATMIGGLLIQALQGYTHFELGLYLRVVFGMKLLDYVILAALAMTIHVVVNHKYLGHILVLVGILAPPLLRLMGLVRDNLLLYGRDPGWLYSDMNGFGPFAEPFVWFKLYWAGWALLLLVGAVLFWVRGHEGGLRLRLRQARERFAGRVAAAAGLALVPILAFGGFVFYNTHVLNPTAVERESRQAEYEKRYRRYADLAQPTIESAELLVEIYPDQSAVDLRGGYVLVNRTGVAIDSVHVFLDPDVEARSLSLDRAAEAVLVDEEVGYRIYTLERALEPGDSLQLAFDVGFRQRGFPNGDIPTEVVANGTSFNRMKMPIIGYQPLFELSDGEARERFGLAPQPPTPGPKDAAAAAEGRWSIHDSDLVHVDAIIGTAADQTAITPGVLRRSWTENGRRYFHYVTETPIAFGGTVASARYDVLEDRWNDVTLRIFHHPAHKANLDRMVRGMKASLEYLTEQFGPYPYSDLRIVEIPRYGGFGSAHPHTITFTEDVFFSRVREGQVDQPFYGTAHEVAHTWWGGLVRGAGVRGAGFLSESLANYSAMLVTEKTYGPEAGRRVYEFQMERYFRGRAEFSREVPVLQVEDQPYIAYRRGAIALYMLRDLIGEEAVNGALRRYFERYRDAGPPYPTSLDLYAELRAVTPDSLHGLLEDLFETVTLWDVRAERATAEPTGTGEYEVTLTVGAKKVRADSVGRETEVPMDEWVEIGVFAAGEGDELGEPLYLERHRIRRGEQKIRITVPREPARAGIDPYRKLIDRQRDDNVVGVEVTWPNTPMDLR